MNRLCFALATALSFALSANAQSPGYLTSSNQTGLPDYGSFLHSDIDSINLQNGSVNVRIPFLSRKMRHFEYTAGLRYDSKMWVADKYSYWGPPPMTSYSWRVDQVAGGWHATGGPQAQLEWLERDVECPPDWMADPLGGDPIIIHNGGTLGIRSNFTLLVGDGTKYQFPTRKVYQRWVPDPANSCVQQYTYQNFGDVTVPYSASGRYRLDFSGTWASPIMKITAKDGSWSTSGAVWHDTNGNLSLGSDSEGWSLDNTGRRVGRWIEISPNLGYVYSQQFQYYDSDGVVRSVTVDYIRLTANTTFPTTVVDEGLQFFNSTQQFEVVGKITLANSLTYTFAYDPNFLELTQITLPTGGSIRYEYATLELADSLPPAPEYVCNGDLFQPWCQHAPYATQLDARVLVKKTLEDEQGNKEVWTFGGGTVTHSSSTTGQTDTQLRMYADYSTSGNGQLMEISVDYMEGGTTLKRVETQWVYDLGPVSASTDVFGTDPQWGLTIDPRNMRVARTTTTLFGGPKSA